MPRVERRPGLALRWHIVYGCLVLLIAAAGVLVAWLVARAAGV